MKAALQRASSKITLSRASILISATAITAFMRAVAFAQDFAGDVPDIGIPESAGEEDIKQTIGDILKAVLNFLALIAVVVVVIAGIRLIVSQGEDDAKDKAKKTILYALIGLIIVLFARVIVGLVTDYLATEVV